MPSGSDGVHAVASSHTNNTNSGQLGSVSHTAVGDGSLLLASVRYLVVLFSCDSLWFLRQTDESYAKGRKLRHLTGIVLRNLTTEEVPSRPHEKSTNDDCLEAAWKHSCQANSTHRSLQREGGEVQVESNVGETVDPVHSKSSHGLAAGKLARSPKPRRRSARGNLVGMENPILRQKRLADVVVGRMADVFFTLHIPELRGKRYPPFC